MGRDVPVLASLLEYYILAFLTLKQNAKISTSDNAALPEANDCLSFKTKINFKDSLFLILLQTTTQYSRSLLASIQKL